MKLIIGLGNPGNNYQKTRHNVGFMVADKISDQYNLGQFKLNARFNSEIVSGTIDGKNIIIAKPQTFMNNSGKAVSSIIGYYKINIEDLLVIHDDLDIKLGDYRISKDKNSAGHNGVQSIIDHLATKNFERIRIGIGIEDQKIPTEDYVLNSFHADETAIIDRIISEISGKIKERI